MVVSSWWLIDVSHHSDRHDPQHRQNQVRQTVDDDGGGRGGGDGGAVVTSAVLYQRTMYDEPLNQVRRSTRRWKVGHGRRSGQAKRSVLGSCQTTL